MATDFSPHFSRASIEKNPTALRNGIVNVIPDDQLAYWRAACKNVLEPMRTIWKKSPFYVSCGYRCPQVNNLTPNANKNSAHRGFIISGVNKLEACAFDIDMDVYNLSNADFFVFVVSNFLDRLDKAVYEYGWVHLQFRERPRHTAWILRPGEDAIQYKAGMKI